jgi:biotin synthase-like enzyme
LREGDPGRFEELWFLADAVRREEVGDAVHSRGLMELSNPCVRSCGYCDANVTNRMVDRTRMTAEEVLRCAREAAVEEQSPATELMTYRKVALARLVRPDASYSSPTALATLNLESGRELGLSCGANVFTQSLTLRIPGPLRDRSGKRCLHETS